MKKNLLVVSFIVFAVFGQTTIVGAAITTYTCDYGSFSDSDGNHLVNDPFILTFIVDSDTEKAYMKGNQGAANVLIVQGSSSLTFIEVTDAGNVMTTTIDSEANSVHSRNTVLFGELVPSQFYGTCITQ